MQMVPMKMSVALLGVREVTPLRIHNRWRKEDNKFDRDRVIASEVELLDESLLSIKSSLAEAIRPLFDDIARAADLLQLPGYDAQGR